MSPKETARRYYELVDAGDYDALVALFSEDVVYERPGQPAIEGRAALREFYEAGRPLSNGEHELHAVVSDSEEQSSSGNRTQSDDVDESRSDSSANQTQSDDDSTVAVRGSFRGDQNGDRVEFGFADFHEFEDGEIARRYTFTDRDSV